MVSEGLFIYRDSCKGCLIACSSIFSKNAAGRAHTLYNFTNFWNLALRESLAIELKRDRELRVGFHWQAN